MHKTEYRVKRKVLLKDQGIRTEITGPFGLQRNLFYLDSRLHNSKERITGKMYVDGEYVSDWVQYK